MAFAEEENVEPEEASNCSNVDNMIHMTIDASEMLGNYTESQFRTVFECGMIDEMKEAISTAPRRLKANLTECCDVASNLCEFLDYMKANATKCVQDVTVQNITADGELIDCLVDHHFLYTGNVSLEETCNIITTAYNMSDEFNLKVAKRIENLTMSTTDGIGPINDRFVSLAREIRQWEHKANKTVIAQRKQYIHALVESIAVMVVKLDGCVDTELANFAVDVEQDAAQTDAGMRMCFDSLTALQTSLQEKMQTTEIKRPTV